MVLVTKQDMPDSELDQQARSIKTKPPLIAMNDENVNELINYQNTMSRQDFYDMMYTNHDVELMRGGFAKYM